MIEETLHDRGYTPAQVAEITTIVDAAHAELSHDAVKTVLLRVFMRVDRDSVAGRALARALGFTGDQSLARAAKDFGVSKQYLHRLEEEIRLRLGKL